MYVIRPITLDDLPHLLSLAQLTHTSLLPADPDDVVGNLGARAERDSAT